ncbi:hypothetical protein GCM10027614_79890 [Micromonospora vulcania]
MLVALSLAAFAFITTELLPVGLLTHIAPDLDRSRSQVGLLVSGYAVVVVLASVPLARLTQRIPRRQLLGVTMLLFAAANAAAALAPTYAVLAGSRLLTALAQALFWSIATATVTGPFPVAVRGRVVALFSTGATLAPVLGVPLGTWLGQQAGWRVAFAVLAGIGLAIAAAVLVLLPSYPPAAGGAARGTAPDRRAFAWLLIATALGIGGFMTLQTYVTPFLLDVSGFADAVLAPLLFVSGAAGVVGTLAATRTLDTRPVASLLTPLSIGTASLFGLYALGALGPPWSHSSPGSASPTRRSAPPCRTGCCNWLRAAPTWRRPASAPPSTPASPADRCSVARFCPPRGHARWHSSAGC